ncbi:hypothetical protein QL285_037157 [Trifolium repens]|nr:hypothetical protein QL285_037157 [Trifolium repens]
MAANLTKKSEWLESIHQALSSMHNENVQAQLFSIYSIPESLKNCNLDAYMPRVVSIGPRFIGREDLLPMEEVKLRCILTLLNRASNNPKERLEACGEAVRTSVEVVRASYSPDMVELGKLSDLDLAKIMLVDGCFLLELLISKELDSQLERSIPGPSAELIYNDDVLSDLMLFENQIPIFVLYVLFQTLFPTQGGEGLVSRDWSTEEMINIVVLSLLGYHNLEQPNLLKATHSPTILDLVRIAVNRRQVGEPYVVETRQEQQQRPKLNRCALRLLTAGVTILPEDKDSTGFSALSWLSDIFVVNSGKHMDNIPEAEGLDFYFDFYNNKLEIKQLHITKTTKAKWCNLIAMEHHQKIQCIQTTYRPGSIYSSNSIWAALIFNDLICSADDVQFLKDKKIIVDHVNMSNQELMEFFRKIPLGFDYRAVVDSNNYSQMVDNINNFSKAFVIKRIWSTVWNSFTYRQEWLLRFLNRNYNLVATVISLCTVVQTIYAIIAYQFPKK